MRVVVIGGSGHIGSFLTPRLVEGGHEVICVSRGKRAPYVPSEAWKAVRTVALDRVASEQAGAFGGEIAALNPDAVIDITCYRPESARHLVEALRGRIARFLHCGTIWVHGHSVVVPTTEDQPRRPFGDYGKRKAAIEAYLLEEARERRFPVVVLHPGHLVGPGWRPVTPYGNFNSRVFGDLAAGRQVWLPNLGMETVHHVHADDVAQAFARALAAPDSVVGESFHVVSPAAVTLRGYAEIAARWFGREAMLDFMPFEEWKMGVEDRDAAATWDHISHSPHCSIEKARRLLDYSPRYSSMAAVKESVEWLVEKGDVAAPRPS